MSNNTRSKAARDDDAVITAEVPLKISDAVQRIGSALGVRLPLPNDPIAAAAQEYYVAKEVAKAADARSKAARDALLPLITVPTSKGKHTVHDSRTAVVIADQRAEPRRLSEDAVVNMLCRDFKLSVDEARSKVDAIKSGGNGLVTHLTVVLK